MSIAFFDNIKDAIAHLSPHEVRDQAGRPVRIGLFAESERAYQQMEDYFVPAELSEKRRAEVAGLIERSSFVPGRLSTQYDLEIYSQETRVPDHGFAFYMTNPERTIQEILKAKPDLAVALARHIYPFRAPYADLMIRKVAKENALFSVATAIPDIVPLITLPWAIGEFASDTAVLTANQIRLAFLLAAASDREIGYSEQKAEIVSILLGAFGWRALARELVAKIPFGGGLIPKAAIAYAGTKVAGMSIERLYRVGHGFSREERDAAFREALDRGKTVAGSILSGFKRRAEASQPL
jgi:hypothetical protein